MDRNEKQSVNLFLVDIRDDLLNRLELSKATSVSLIKADLSKAEEIDRVWTKITANNSKVDILVNNAARVQGKRLMDMQMSDFRESIQVNLLAYVHLTKLFLD